jgi:glycosyltransferase involved in cell wall biosynthesis
MNIADSMNKVHRRDPIDVIEMEESYGWFADVGRITKIPVVVKLHGPAFMSMVGSELNTAFAREKIEREGAALALANAIVAPSVDTLTRTIAKYKLTPRMARQINNPLMLEQGTPIWQLGKCEPHTVLFVGRFDLRKGADVVLGAFALLARKRTNLRLIFVGPDIGIPDRSGHLVGFRSYCAANLDADVAGRIDYRGRMSNQEICELRTKAMVTVVASRWESQGYTALEAMLQGCPIVCSDAGALPESVVDGSTGLLAASESPEMFAQQIGALLDDPVAAANLGRRARLYVETAHSPQVVARDSLALYTKVVETNRR